MDRHTSPTKVYKVMKTVNLQSHYIVLKWPGTYKSNVCFNFHWQRFTSSPWKLKTAKFPS